MTPALALVLLISIAAIAAMYVSLRGHHRELRNIQDIEGSISPVNLASFARITDPRDQDFLRSSLPSKAYRRIQRERILIAIQYVKSAARNAAILIRVGEMQSRVENPEVQARSKALIDECLRLRIICLAAIFMLYVSFLFPEQNVSVMDLIFKYEHMSDSLNLLSMLTDPLLASRVRSWL